MNQELGHLPQTSESEETKLGKGRKKGKKENERGKPMKDISNRRKSSPQSLFQMENDTSKLKVFWILLSEIKTY